FGKRRFTAADKRLHAKSDRAIGMRQPADDQTAVRELTVAVAVGQPVRAASDKELLIGQPTGISARDLGGSPIESCHFEIGRREESALDTLDSHRSLGILACCGGCILSGYALGRRQQRARRQYT